MKRLFDQILFQVSIPQLIFFQQSLKNTYGTYYKVKCTRKIQLAYKQ